MPLRPGDLDRIITIMRAEPVDDGTATVPGQVAPIGDRWASKLDVSDGERVRAEQNGQAITTRFVVRWDELTSTISGADLLVCDGRTYAVVGTKEVEGRREAIEITANAQLDMQA